MRTSLKLKRKSKYNFCLQVFQQIEIKIIDDSKVVIQKSLIEGNGYFTDKPIKEGKEVFKWEGEIASDSDLKKIESSGKYHSSVAIGEDKNLLFDVVDPKEKKVEHEGSGTGGLNHSCDPNLWMKDEVTIVARRDIKEGEELTIDYAMFTVAPDFKIENCSCGSQLCRHTISGNDWMLKDLQERYKDHFSSFINERIEKANL